ncbi:class I SAM-dependent methyltransferase [Paenibacillus eucommiae]|uniref:SAM-dependent methyltransferase n=1 Tax=Paenibacillus eucommiae TaxID=1355755 RepID=A0ABS4IVH0_9BACL|nr:class I SAM-dependent methyltransferase [Paenibacillus eucommiae]MBP1991587.1 SAM-dependent methyltransferase [Paenibacillus eucommiae]
MKDKSLQKIINRAYEFNEEQQNALDQGIITEEEWYEINKQHFSSHYIASDNPRGQSGHSGNEHHYFQSHFMILEAIHKNGSFIDVGCANGYLLESLDRWTKSLGYYSVEFYGLDISEGLIDLAVQRLPDWKDRLFIGNAMYWKPEAEKYDFVCVKELSYVPVNKQRSFLERLLNHYVAPGGRLILGPNGEERETRHLENQLSKWGYKPTGYMEKSHHNNQLLARRMVWFDKE